MILRPLGPAAIFYRFHAPRYAALPVSGTGAALHGGRFNRRGIEALYLSTNVATAHAEYSQDELLTPPGTLVTYQVTLGKVVDVSAGYEASTWGEAWEDWDCDWRVLSLGAHIEPPSWVLGDLARELGASGILFPSLKLIGPGNANLAVYTKALGPRDVLTMYDPTGQLPKNQSSWQ
jgi:RES domain-containing protein